MWQTKKLGEVCEINGGNAAPQDKSFFKNGTLPFVRMQDLGRYHITTNLIDTTDKLNKKAVENLHLKIWSKGSILLPRSGSVYMNHRAILGCDAYVVSHIAILTNFREVLNKYLFYYLSILDIGSYGSKTTGIDSISFGQLRRLKVKFPPLPIQQEIVSRLDAIRKAQEVNDKQIALTDELFQSLLQKELNPKGKKWEIKKLIEIADINPKTEFKVKNNVVKYVEMAAIDENLKEIKYFQDRPMKKLSSGLSKFKFNDIIFARITPCTEHGKVAVVENSNEVCAGSTEFHVIRSNQTKIIPRFLFYHLITSQIKDRAVASMIGSTGRQRVPAEFFRFLKIPVPQLETQRQIVEKLQSVQDYKKKLLEQKKKLQELFDSALHKSFNQSPH
jgi:type I restriction enzyme S subunit